MEGWIKLHRKILKWEWWNDDFMYRFFTGLILMANHKDKKHRGILIKRGQLMSGRTELSEKYKTTERRIRTALSRLKATNEVTIQPTNKYSIITITNYEDYQPNDQQVDQQTTNKRPTNDHQLTTNKNGKKEKNEKNGKKNIKNMSFGKCEIFETYNDFVSKCGNDFKKKLRPLALLSEERRNKISKAEKHGLNDDMFIKILNNALQSRFVSSGKFFNFDWLFRVRNSKGESVCNWLDLYEGKYSNNNKKAV